jgi:hypothetical protein
MDKKEVETILRQWVEDFDKMRIEELSQPVTNYQMKNLVWVLSNAFKESPLPEPDQSLR